MVLPGLTPNEHEQMYKVIRIIHNLEETIINLEAEIKVKNRRIHELSEKLILARIEEKVQHGKRR